MLSFPVSYRRYPYTDSSPIRITSRISAKLQPCRRESSVILILIPLRRASNSVCRGTAPVRRSTASPYFLRMYVPHGILQPTWNSLFTNEFTAGKEIYREMGGRLSTPDSGDDVAVSVWNCCYVRWGCFAFN